MSEQHHDGPVHPPVDVDEERERLLADAAERGVDPQDALDLADEVGRSTSSPEALRAVDRRIATGHTIEETKEILLGSSPTVEKEREPGVGGAVAGEVAP